MDLGPVVYVEDFEKHFLAEAAEFYQVTHPPARAVDISPYTGYPNCQAIYLLGIVTRSGKFASHVCTA